MTDQRPLFRPPPATGKLTPRQEAVYEALTRGGLTEVDAGLLLHRGKHDSNMPCTYCEDNGRGVLTALRKKGLVKRARETGLWERLDGAGKPSSQGEEIPY